MDTPQAVSLFEILASGARLDIFRLLVRHNPHGLVAGEIARELHIAPTNLSFHLKSMTYNGLLHVTQEGRYQRYRAALGRIEELIRYLTEACCAAHPEQYCPILTATPLEQHPKGTSS